MTTLAFVAMPTDLARACQRGEPDAYGMVPERRISDGGGMPCRHCLRHIPAGEAYLILAYRPFSALQPYAETGPIFLHAEPCERHDATQGTPEILTTSTDYILRGYGDDERIVYGTGAVTLRENVVARAGELLTRDDVAFVHVRSARNNCYQCRIERA